MATSPRRFGALAALLLVHFLAGRLGLELSFVHNAVSPVWPPSGVAIAGLLLLGRNAWPAVFAAAFLFNLLNGSPPLARDNMAFSLLAASANAAEAWVVVWLAERYANGKRAFEMPATALKFCVIALTAGPMLGATIGVLGLQLVGWLDGGAGTVWLTWWLGDAAGAILLAPTLVLWRVPTAISPGRLLQSVLVYSAAIGLALLTFSGLLSAASSAWASIILLPLLLFAAVRLGARDAMTVLLLSTGTALVGTLQGGGPLSLTPPNTALLLLQIGPIGASIAILASTAASPGETVTLDRRGRLSVALAALLPLLLAAALAMFIAGPLQADLESQREAAAAQERTAALKDGMQRNVDAIIGLAAAIEADAEFNRTNFHEYAEASEWFERIPGVTAIAYARETATTDLESLTQEMADDPTTAHFGYPEFAVHPPVNAPRHAVAIYLEPIAGNEAAYGLDVGFEPTRASAIDAARIHRTTQLSGPVPLVGAPDGRTGFLLIHPVERNGELLGYTISAHDAQDFVVDALGDENISLADAGPAHEEGRSPAGYLVGTAQKDTSGHAIHLHGRIWVVETDDRSHLRRSEVLAPWFILAGGALTSVLLAGIAYLSATTTQRSKVIASRLTADLQESNQRLQRFAYAASHDLQQPLTTMQGYLDLLEPQKERLDDEGREFFAELEASVGRMRRLIQGLLAYSRAGREMTRKPCDVYEAVEELKPELERAKCVENASAHTAHVDPAALQVMLRNALSNALKFSGEAPQVRVETRREGATTTITIEDDGIGVPEEDRERVFDVFTRLHSADRYQGTGMGLALVRRLAQAHGGDAWLEESSLGGTRLCIRIPDGGQND